MESSFKEERSTLTNRCLIPFDNLRLLNLKKVSVTFSESKKFSGKSFGRGELEAMEDDVRQRLLDPVITPQEYLADSIRKLKGSLRSTEKSVKIHTKEIQNLQQKLDASRLEAERKKVEINELQAM